MDLRLGNRPRHARRLSLSAVLSSPVSTAPYSRARSSGLWPTHARTGRGFRGKGGRATATRAERSAEVRRGRSDRLMEEMLVTSEVDAEVAGPPSQAGEAERVPAWAREVSAEAQMDQPGDAGVRPDASYSDDPASISGPEYLTVEEAAHHLRLSTSTIYRAIQSGRIAAWQSGPGGVYRIPWACVVALEAREGAPGPRRQQHPCQVHGRGSAAKEPRRKPPMPETRTRSTAGASAAGMAPGSVGCSASATRPDNWGHGPM